MIIRQKLAIAAAIAVGLASSQAQAQQATVTLMAYSGIFQERYQKAVVEPFMKANPGITVNYYGLPSSAQMLGVLRTQKSAPQTDVVLFDVTVAKSGADDAIFEKIDETSVPNIADLHRAARIPDINGVGVLFDNLVLLYNADLVKTPPAAISDLADKSHVGKVVIPGLPDIQGLSMVMLLENKAGGKNYMQDVDKGLAAMGTIAPNVQTWAPTPDVYSVIISGQASVGAGWNARAQVNSILSNGRLKTVLPAEGTVFQINTINLVANAPAKAAATKFINYALSPEAQKAFTETMFYAPANAKAQIDPEASDRTVVKAMDKVVPVDWITVAKAREQMMEQWRRKVIPLSR